MNDLTKIQNIGFGQEGLPTGAVAIPPPPLLLTVNVTQFKNINQTTSNNLKSWNDLLETIKTPSSMAKTDAPCISSHALNVKTKTEVLAHNAMTLCWVDIDEGDLSLDKIIALMIAMLTDTSFAIYSTASSQRLNTKTDTVYGRRWRVLIQLKETIDCNTWMILQEVFVSLLNADDCGTRVQQILFLPNNPVVTDSREIQHYEYHINNGTGLELSALPQPVYDEYMVIRTAQNAIVNHQPKYTKEDKLDGQIDVITAYNKHYSIKEELINAGYKKARQADKFIRPNGTSPSVKVLGSKSYHHSTSDALADGNAHDAFDVMMMVNKFDFNRAVRHASNMTYINVERTQSINEHNSGIYRKHCRESVTGDLKKLSDYIHSNIGYDDLVYFGNIKKCWDATFVSAGNFYSISDKGDLPVFTAFNYNKKIKNIMWGPFINGGKLLEEMIESNYCQSEKDRLTDKEIEKEVAKTINTLDDLVIGHLEIYRQKNAIEYRTDMFADKAQLIIGKESVQHISIHEPFLMGAYSEQIVDDYKIHFPYLDKFLDLIVASRFAPDRKQAFFWLYAVTDWGKGFLMDIFNDLGILLELSDKEVESAFEGKPLGRTAIDFKNCWILFVDEFKKVSSEIKQLNNKIFASPKNQMSFTSPLYMKVFASAEPIDSLAGEHGVESQFSNRFSLIPAEQTRINDRDLFNASKKEYFDSVKNYIAGQLNTKVSYYINLGENEASKLADTMLSSNNAVHRLGGFFGELDDSIKEIAQEIKQYIRNNYTTFNINNNEKVKILKVEHLGKPALVIKRIDMVISNFISNNISKSEQVKVSYKKGLIKNFIDDTDRTDKNNTVRVFINGKYESVKGVIVHVDS